MGIFARDDCYSPPTDSAEEPDLFPSISVLSVFSVVHSQASNDWDQRAATNELASVNRLTSPLRCRPWFWRLVGLGFVLVLSVAVLVIVIDLSIVLRAWLGNTIEFHRHPSQHRHDPVPHRFHRSIILHCDAFRRHEHILRRHTPEQNREQCPAIEHDL